VSELTQEELQRLFSYDPDTGNFIRRVFCNGQKVGSVAGCKKPTGYIHISIHGKRFQAHRLAWLYMNGKFPDGVVDHINGDPSDNRISNLRDCTRWENLLNQKLHSNNTSGVRGVCWHKASNRWVANAQVNGEMIYLGLFNTKEDAADAYKDFALRNHKQFFNHDPNKYCEAVGDY
jgi:hypothetical protein